MQLLRFSFDDMERLKFWAPYFRNIPNKRELYSKYLFQRKHVPLLQDVQLVRSKVSDAFLILRYAQLQRPGKCTQMHHVLLQS